MKSPGERPGTAPELRRLARLHGVQPAYRDTAGERRTASPETLRAVLAALGVDAAGPARIEEAIRARRAELAGRLVEPATPVSAGGDAAPSVALRLRAGEADGPVTCRLRTEEGERRSWEAEPAGVRPGGGPGGGAGRVRAEVALPAPLPAGYHELEVATGRRSGRTRLLASPGTTWRPSGGPTRQWGVFLPLYALRSAESWGAGDLGDLERLMEWAGGLGADVVGVLPLLAGAERSPDDARVYSPVSRLFWNEIYLAVEDAPGLSESEGARDGLVSPDVRRRIRELRAGDLVDWSGVREAKREVLEPLAREVAGSGPEGRLRSFLDERPEAEAYARFRAVDDAREERWRRWPRGLREPPLPPTAAPEAGVAYHLYVQWLADRQLRRARDARDGTGLYLDLPLGCDPDGFDAWRHQDLFADGATVGAPPDDFFREGQEWGFPPPLPAVMERTGFAYTVASLRHHMRVASRLRLDHVMGLHRLFWIPRGTSPADGVYVRYPSEALHAILCIESHRHRTIVTGEDLGTVPREVRRAMTRRRMERMYVAQLEARPDPERCLPRPPRRSVASLGTHDTATFAGFWTARDVELRREAGLLEPSEAEDERRARGRVRSAWVEFLRREGAGPAAEGRETDVPAAEAGGVDGAAAGHGADAPADLDEEEPAAVLRATLRHLARGRASLVLVNLEDLWLEERPQNVPGTGRERPNFRRKAALDLEEFTTLDAVLGPLREIDRLRRAPAAGPPGR